MALAVETDSSSVRSDKSHTHRRPFTRSAELLPDWQRRPQDVAAVPGELVDQVLSHLASGTDISQIRAETVAVALESLGLRQGDGFPTLEAVVRAVCHKAALSAKRSVLVAASSSITNDGASNQSKKSVPGVETAARIASTSIRPEAAEPVHETLARSGYAPTRDMVPRAADHRTGEVIALTASDPGEDAWGRSTARVREALGLPAPAALAGLMPDWEDDDSRSNCALCNREFVSTDAAPAALAGLGLSGTRAVWRHHCRCCGVLVCCRCAPHTVELAALGKGARPVRICNFCHFDITSSAEVAEIALIP